MVVMFEIVVRFGFEASHTLPSNRRCSRMHGHSWKGAVFLEACELDDNGMVADFDIVEKTLHELRHRYLDHFHLNHSLGLESPTCERIAEWVYKWAKPKMPNLISVEIAETDNARARYKP
jgi:6-pyruvoyltetrahydropterin/6-carboxytetrahydropterin synthase